MGRDLTYREAGVDAEASAEFIKNIRRNVARTQASRKLYGNFGMFAAAYDLSKYREPVLVTSCDGIGTKLELLLREDLLEVAGKDLVAMNVNDVLTTGADPLLFMDYLGVARLESKKLERFVSGMADYLEQCNCILAGGETAEMPGLVPAESVEMAGFCVGCVEKSRVFDLSKIQSGDSILGYASSGLHANGWSLVRKVLEENPQEFTREEVRSLLVPTRLYSDVILSLKKANIRPKAMVHVTGGGIPGNLRRVLSGLGAELELPKWKDELIQRVLSFTAQEELFTTFNMGFGWLAVLDKDVEKSALEAETGGTVLGRVTQSPIINIDVKG